MEFEIYKTDDELIHWGIKGMRWGVRRYQRKDGSLTPAGEKRRARLEADLKQRERVVKNKERTKAKFDKLAAKKRELDEREEALDAAKNAAKASKDKNTSTSVKPMQKSVKDMTDEELREYTNRMQLESNYLNAQRNLAILNPPKVSAGKKFINSLLNDVVAPAAKNAGRAWAENFMKEKLGLNKKAEKSIDDKLKELDLKIRKKNEPLDDIRREIAMLDAQAALEKRQEQ